MLPWKAIETVTFLQASRTWISQIVLCKDISFGVSMLKLRWATVFLVCYFKLMESAIVISISPTSFQDAFFVFNNPRYVVKFQFGCFFIVFCFWDKCYLFSSCLLVSKLSPRYFLKVSIKGMKVSRFTPEAYKSSGATLRHRSHELIVMKEIQEGAPLSYKVVITPANPI